MGEKGNQYYLLAKTTMGRKRIVKTAEEFEEKFLEYVAWSENNPILSRRAMRKEMGVDSDGKQRPPETCLQSESRRRPISMVGLCVYLGVSRKWFEMTIKNLENKREERTEEENALFTSLLRAREFIFMQQYDGACVGEFNPSIVMRSLGINDKVDVTTNGEAVKSVVPIINIIKDERTAGGCEAQ